MVLDKGSVFYYPDMDATKTSLDEPKGWSDCHISDITPRWIEVSVPIEKRDINVVS